MSWQVISAFDSINKWKLGRVKTNCPVAATCTRNRPPENILSNWFGWPKGSGEYSPCNNIVPTIYTHVVSYSVILCRFTSCRPPPPFFLANWPGSNYHPFTSDLAVPAGDGRDITVDRTLAATPDAGRQYTVAHSCQQQQRTRPPTLYSVSPTTILQTINVIAKPLTTINEFVLLRSSPFSLVDDLGLSCCWQLRATIAIRCGNRPQGSTSRPKAANFFTPLGAVVVSAILFTLPRNVFSGYHDN